MKTIAVLNAYGSSVGDDLEHLLLTYHLRAKGFRVFHLWNFFRQKPSEVKKADALIVGPAGVIWYGIERRNAFFLTAIKMAKKTCGLALGYNMGEHLNAEWIAALNKLAFITARGHYSFQRLKNQVEPPLYDFSSLSWLFRPKPSHNEVTYKLGTILNVNANKLNYGTPLPFNLKGIPYIDIPFAEPIEKPLTETIHNREKDPHVAASTIKRCETILSGRLHGLILSLICERPCVTWNDKMKILSQAVTMNYPWIYEVEYLRTLDKEQWTHLFCAIQKTDFKQFIEPMQKLARRNFEILDEWLANV